jgi:hypothetical protein
MRVTLHQAVPHSICRAVYGRSCHNIFDRNGNAYVYGDAYAHSDPDRSA